MCLWMCSLWGGLVYKIENQIIFPVSAAVQSFGYGGGYSSAQLRVVEPKIEGAQGSKSPISESPISTNVFLQTLTDSGIKYS